MFTPEAGEWAAPIFICLAACVVIAYVRTKRGKK
jgi:hypothetical protein